MRCFTHASHASNIILSNQMLQTKKLDFFICDKIHAIRCYNTPNGIVYLDFHTTDFSPRNQRGWCQAWVGIGFLDEVNAWIYLYRDKRERERERVDTPQSPGIVIALYTCIHCGMCILVYSTTLLYSSDAAAHSLVSLYLPHSGWLSEWKVKFAWGMMVYSSSSVLCYITLD